MSKNIEIAGTISFGGKLLNVYGDLDAPLFKAKDMNSWEKSDSWIGCKNGDKCEECYNLPYDPCGMEWENLYIGENDHSLMQRLSNAGTEHRKYMRMMPVYVRITAPLYW